MVSATIVAAKVFQPKPGKKRGTIVTPDEVLYGAMPPILSKVQIGGAYDIEYKEDHFNGKTYLVIEGIWPAKNAAPPAPVAAAAPSYAPKYGNQDMATAERIFVCGGLNAVLGNTNLNPAVLGTDDIVGYVASFREAWRLTFGTPTGVKVPNPKNGDMGDEIPF